ncbi:MAG TPA: hypothetical protein PKU88_09020 [Bacillota bacterium]|nr:hypothetical protein [Clostridiaceae bacterium]HNR04141.1 hypothetical protein [Bacillota bacterium]HNT02756.1 hypothetical protein [Bacillota bacterium]HPA54020.1 hypothetical protein [Bacillota bacterium]HPX69454.1 hypothetical protein [Bacillota bacterium]
MLDKHICDRGSYTVEASMVFVTIMLALLALLFTFLYMGQRASLESFASFAAQQGAELWLDSRRNMEDGKINNKRPEDSMGYRIFDNLLFSSTTYEGYFEREASDNGKTRVVFKMDAGNNLPGHKALLIGEDLCKRIESTILKPESTRIRITFNNNALRGRLIVELIQEIKVPLGGIKEFFDGKDTLTLSVQSEAAVSEPDEYIRNVDLILELSKRLGEELDLGELAGRIGAKR